MHANNFESNMQNGLRGQKEKRIMQKKGSTITLHCKTIRYRDSYYVQYNNIQSSYQISLEND